MAVGVRGEAFAAALLVITLRGQARAAPVDAPDAPSTRVQSDAATPEPATVQAPDPSADAMRAKLLATHTNEFVQQKNRAEVLGYVFGVGGMVAFAFGIPLVQRDTGLGATWLAGFGATTTAFLVSFGATRDTRVDVLEMLPPLDNGILGLSIVFAEDPPIPKLSGGSYGAAFLAEGVLDAINSLSRRTKLSKLRENRDHLVRGTSRGAFGGMERDLLGSDVPLSGPVRAIPFGLGAAVGIIPAFDSKRTGSEQLMSGLLSGILALNGLAVALVPNPASSYRRDLDASGLSLLAMPGRIGFRYRF